MNINRRTGRNLPENWERELRYPRSCAFCHNNGGRYLRFKVRGTEKELSYLCCPNCVDYYSELIAAVKNTAYEIEMYIWLGWLQEYNSGKLEILCSPYSLLKYMIHESSTWGEYCKWQGFAKIVLGTEFPAPQKKVDELQKQETHRQHIREWFNAGELTSDGYFYRYEAV